MWGRSAKEIVGKPQTVLHPPENSLPENSTFGERMPELLVGKTLTVSESILRGDESVIPIEISVRLERYKGKKVLVGSFISTEKREQAFLSLQNRTLELDAIFETSQVGIMHLNNGRFLANVNQKLVDILGYDSREEMIGISTLELHLNKERFEWFGKHHYEPLRNRESIHIQYKLCKKSGEPLWVALSGKAVDDNVPADLDRGVIWIVDDISDFKELEKNFQIKNSEITEAKERVEYLVENLNGVSWEFDLEKELFTYVSKNVKKLLGYEVEDWNTFESWAEMVYEPDREAALSYCATETREKRNHAFEYRMLKKDGTVIWVMDLVSLGFDKEGNPNMMFGYIIDNTQQKKLQLKIEHEHKYLQSIINGVEDPIMVIGDDYNIKLMNKTIEKKLNTYSLADKEHPKCYEISHGRSTPCDGVEHQCPLKQVLETQKSVKVIHNHGEKGGEDLYAELAASPLFDDDGNCVGIIESARDITEHIKMQNRLDFQAHHDSLTTLPNRMLFHDRLQQGIEKAQRNRNKLGVIFLDLDRFKHINDSLGHDVGDTILVEVSLRLQNILRKEDTLSRLGGDEFTILFEDIHETQVLIPLVQKILHSFNEPFVVEEHKLYLTSSIGISVYPNDSLDKDELLKYADAAMYRAKDEGRNNFQFYTAEMTQQAFEHMVLEASLRQAIVNEEFEVYFQPQYNGANKTIIGAEALVRWNHPTMGRVAPDKFIPLAEETGLVVSIDRWVMHSAMKSFKVWLDKGMIEGKLSLNLAIKQLESDDFIDFLQKSLAELEFSVEYLKLEILEHDMMRRPEKSILKLTEIKKLGVELAIDDFGTGQSSLSYLQRFPVDTLKIDQSFVRGIESSKENRLLKAIIALAEAMQLQTIAEGVETKAELDFLIQNGCENIQGYYFSRPLSRKDFENLILSEN